MIKNLKTDNKYVIIKKKGRLITIYEIIFYEDEKGNSDVVNYLDELQERGKTDKTSRLNRKKILEYISSLATYGTRIGMPIVEHIDGNLWQLRPIKNRIFFFYWKDNQYVLLHHFVKKTNKTPKREIEKAFKEIKDFIERNDK